MDPEVNTTTTEENDADFESGFESGTTTIPTETPGGGEQQKQDEGDAGSQQEPEAKQPEYVQVTKDEWESLKSSAAKIGQIEATMEQRFGTAFGKMGGIERTLKELGESPKVNIPDGDIEALKTGGFPELANALEQMRSLRSLPGGGSSLAKDEVEQSINQRVSEARESVRRDVEMRLLRKEHPDYKSLEADPAFGTWFGGLPETEQQEFLKANTEYDADVMSSYLTRFKQTRKAAAAPAPSPQARQSRIAAAVTPRGSSAPAAQTSTDDEFEAGFKSG